MQKVIKKQPHLSAVGLGIFGIKSLGTTAGAVAGSSAILAAGELVAKAVKSPILRKHYLKVIEHALKDDAASAARSMTALDRELKKSEDI